MAAGKNPSDSPKKTLGKVEAASPDRHLDQALRPEKFDSFVGQARTVERLKVMVGAARRESRTLDHILIHGPPGLGKTTLAMILAGEMNKTIRITAWDAAR